MSANTLPDLAGSFNSYAAYVENLLVGRCEPAAAVQVVDIVAGLEAALKRQAQDDIDIELRLTVLEEALLKRLQAIDAALSIRPSS